MITQLVENQLTGQFKREEIPLVIELDRRPDNTDIDALHNNGLDNIDRLEGQKFVFGSSTPDGILKIDRLPFVRIVDADRVVRLHREPPGYLPTPIRDIEEELDSEDIVSINDTAEFVRARDTLEQYGADGDGVKVAVLDTGCDHRMIDGAKVAERDFTDTDLKDRVGHGSWVAGHILGRPATYHGDFDKFTGDALKGIAPEADLIAGKVLTNVGADAVTTPQSVLMKSMKWAVKDENADIVNMSLGVLPACGITGSSRLLDELTEQEGAIFTVSAGNAYTFGTIGAPAQAHLSVAVSSVATVNPRANQMSTFSSKGPACARSGINVAAPGGNIDPNEWIAGPAPSYSEYGGSGGWAYFAGTSMSAPNVAGILAQIESTTGIDSREDLERGLSVSSRNAGAFSRMKGPRYGWGVIDSLQLYKMIDNPVMEAQGKLRAKMSTRDAKVSPVSDLLSSSDRKVHNPKVSRDVTKQLEDYYSSQKSGEAIAWDSL